MNKYYLFTGVLQQHSMKDIRNKLLFYYTGIPFVLFLCRFLHEFLQNINHQKGEQSGQKYTKSRQIFTITVGTLRKFLVTEVCIIRNSVKFGLVSV